MLILCRVEDSGRRGSQMGDLAKLVFHFTRVCVCVQLLLTSFMLAGS